ncbi:MGMT family protein [Cohnella zeiphila]|uniref:MGMT family protein n=1 Tax=Cohnella zeiphila TaxID=2761120 RepID=A0A7X0VWE7_9BACL|nr:MGMT family protein [Cohnella zeiphila]MBB6733134.1 MGMT family protein [Cohnella zeiphila]
MQPFTERVIAIIKGIPPGSVMTYGQIAACAGSPRAARQVVRILHSMSGKHDLPWHRVVNSKGEIAIQGEEGRYTQQLLLQEEGVEPSLGRIIDLESFQHHPAPESGKAE